MQWAVIEAFAICFFRNAFTVFLTILQVKQCPLPHEAFHYNEIGTLMRLHQICTKQNAIVHFVENQEQTVKHTAREIKKFVLLEPQPFYLPSKP